jgi:hypothetical protein
MKDFLECFSHAIQERHGMDPRAFLRSSEPREAIGKRGIASSPTIDGQLDT